jgi:diguanylate cyclase (GGDEF)-like protein
MSEQESKQQGLIREQIDNCLADKRRWWELYRFPRELRCRYEQDTLAILIRETVFVSAIGIVLCDLFLATDYAENPSGMRWSLILRLGLFTPITALATWIAYRWRARFVREWMCFLVMLFTGSCAFSTVQGVNATVSALTQPGLLTVILVGTSLLRIPLLFAGMTVVGLMIEDGVFLVHDPWLTIAQKLSCAFIVVAFSGVTLLARGRAELLERRSYLLRLREELRSQQFRELNENLADLSNRDSLTGLANRRGLNEHFERIWSNAARNDQFVSVIMIDIDKFKSLNDTYGHPFGDEVLTEVAKCLQSAIRQEDDMVARYGGEEFVVLLPRADLSQVRETAERLRRRIIELTFMPHGANRPVSISASFGVASTGVSMSIDPSELIALADQAMYGAKRAGGNCVSWGNGQVSHSRNLAPRDEMAAKSQEGS